MHVTRIMGASYEPSNILVYCFIGATVAIMSLCLLVQSASVVVNWKRWLEKMEETGASCITEHEGFNAVWLQTAYFQYRQQYGNHHEETPIRK